jgi:hypothetical protein
MTDTYYSRNKERLLKQAKERRENDPAWREKKLAYNRMYNSERKELANESRKAWLKANPAWTMYKNAKRRAVDFKLPFDITYHDIIIPTHCPVFGIPLDRSTPEHRPTLDRIKPELGYVKGNICVISDRANRKKQDSSVEELEQILNYIKSF